MKFSLWLFVFSFLLAYSTLAVSITPYDIYNVQDALKSKGYEPGPSDGLLGDRTLRAVRNYQRDMGYQISGELDYQTLNSLGITGNDSPQNFQLKNGESCSYYGENVTDDIYTFGSNMEAINVVKRITNVIGLPPNFTILSANVPNAAAVIRGSKRYILYSNFFMERISNRTNTDWAALSILAHEIGHHLSGHTLTSGGSRPSIELEADEFSGFAVARLGGTLQQAQVAMQNIASTSGSTTHPPKSARLEAITIGWKKGKQNTSANNTSKPKTTSKPKIEPRPRTEEEKCWTEIVEEWINVEKEKDIEGSGQRLNGYRSRSSGCSAAKRDALKFVDRDECKSFIFDSTDDIKSVRQNIINENCDCTYDWDNRLGFDCDYIATIYCTGRQKVIKNETRCN